LKLKPLSPLLFLARNPGRSLPMIAIIMLAVVLIAGIVAIIDSIPLSVQKVYGYSRFLTGVTPRGDMSYFPTILRHFEKSPVPIERRIICRTSIFNVNTIVGPWPFVLHGINPNDFDYLSNKLRLGRLDGRQPISGRGEAVITKPIAKNLRLHLGSIMLSPHDEKNYSLTPVVVVGIYDSDQWFAYTSYEYLVQTHFPPVDVAIYFAKDQQTQRRLDAWADKTLAGTKANVYTYPKVERDTAESLAVLFRILDLVVGLLVVVITIMMCMLVNIYLSQRIVEFGLLQAIGISRKRLVTRTVAEAAWMILTGWIVGSAVTAAVLTLIRNVLMNPKGYYIDPLDPLAYVYTIPVPAAVLITSIAIVLIKFAKFDPIAVIERRIV